MFYLEVMAGEVHGKDERVEQITRQLVACRLRGFRDRWSQPGVTAASLPPQTTSLEQLNSLAAVKLWLASWLLVYISVCPEEDFVIQHS